MFLCFMKLRNAKGLFFDEIKEHLRNSLENQTFVKGFLIYCVPYNTTKCIPLILEFVL